MTIYDILKLQLESFGSSELASFLEFYPFIFFPTWMYIKRLFLKGSTKGSRMVSERFTEKVTILSEHASEDLLLAFAD